MEGLTVSGGSYNYLCYREDLEDLIGNKYDIESMRVTLSDLGYADEAAKETQELLDLMAQWDAKAQEISESLKEVWKAIEWWHSCDYSEEDVKKALAKYRVSRKEKDQS
jgi:hypothetical protein